MINLYEAIRVEIEEEYNPSFLEETSTAIVYVGNKEIYRLDVGWIEDYQISDAKDRALIPLAKFLKKGVENQVSSLTYPDKYRLLGGSLDNWLQLEEPDHSS